MGDWPPEKKSWRNPDLEADGDEGVVPESVGSASVCPCHLGKVSRAGLPDRQLEARESKLTADLVKP